MFSFNRRERGAVNNSIAMGRSDTPAGFGPAGYYMGKFAPRIGAYGLRVFIANDVIPQSAERNFKYRTMSPPSTPKTTTPPSAKPPPPSPSLPP